MARDKNPAVDRHCPMSGPPGEARGHIHWADHASRRLAHQCADCGAVNEHAYDEIAEHHHGLLELVGVDVATVAMPPCPACGAQAFYAHNDVEYGQELPHAFSGKAIRELVQKERLRCHTDHHRPDERHQGRDFSHLPAKDRPKHHQRVTDADLEAEARRQPGPPQ